MNDTITPFDADSFMQQQMDAPMETEFKLCPAGEYPAAIGDFTREAFQQFEFEYKKGPKAGQPGSMLKFTCPFVINDDQAKAAVGREAGDQLIVTKQMILDRDANGQLDFGVNKNIELGRLREAVNQNTPGPWNPGMLRNQGPVMVKVEHREITRSDGTKTKIAEVTRVVRLS